MNDDMHGYMTELGSSDTPEPDPRFVTNLELQLRESRAGATAYRFARPRRWPATVAAVTFSVAVVAFGLATVDTSPQVVSISAASGAEVRMPDGQVVEATPGLELPNGAVVEVGPAGSARIGDIDVGPLQAAEITAEGVIVAGDDIAGPIRFTTTAVGSQVSVISTPVTVNVPTSTPTSPNSAGGTGSSGSSGNGERTSSTSEPVTSTSDPATTSTSTEPDTSTAGVEPTTPPASSSSLPISATSIVRTTTTTAPTPTTSESQTTSTSSSSTTSLSSTTLVLASTTTSSTTVEAPTDSTTTTTDYDDHPTTTTSSSTTTQPGSTSTTTTVDPTSTTSTTTAVDPTFLKIIGDLRFELASCQVDTATLASLVYAIATDSLSPGQSTVLKSCLG